MQVIILAAGYATRLYPLTKDQPKPLLDVAGKTMLSHVVDALPQNSSIRQVHIVTNAKFTPHFQNWVNQNQENYPFTFSVVNDGSTNDENKLGAIGDIDFTLNEQKIEEDILIVAGDNLFDMALDEFIHYGQKKNTPVLALYDVGNLEDIKKYNSVSTDPNGRITYFEEKSQHPESTLTGIALYYYPAFVVPMIRQYVQEGNNPDQPGRLIQWLYTRTDVYTWTLPGIWFDVGSKESLEEANRVFSASASS